MGFLSLLAPCLRCGQLFTSNPYRVPSVRVGGERVAICRDCVDNLNRRRVAAGLNPVAILPGAYDPADEYGDVDDLDLDVAD